MSLKRLSYDKNLPFNRIDLITVFLSKPKRSNLDLHLEQQKGQTAIKNNKQKHVLKIT